MDVVPVLVIGLGASLLTELLKLFPVLSQTDERKKIVAFLVALVLSLIYLPSTGQILNGFSFVIGVLGATFVIYKALVQPVENAVSSVYKVFIKVKEA